MAARLTATPECPRFVGACTETACRYNLACRTTRDWHCNPLIGCAVPHFGRPHTLDETGALLGLTRERVRQIEERALRKLRQECRRVGLTWLDFCHVYPHIIPSGLEFGDTTFFYHRFHESRARYMARLRVRKAFTRFRAWAQGGTK